VEGKVVRGRGNDAIV